MYCVAILEEPKKDGKIVFVSGDGRDKAFVWTVVKESEMAQDKKDVSEEEKESTDTPKTDPLQCVQIHELEGHTETVEFCKFDSTGKFLVTAGMNN